MSAPNEREREGVLMDIRITNSVAQAINLVLALERGILQQRDDRLVAPTWCNFRASFFSRIRPRPVRKISRVERSQDRLGHWTVVREVEFYFHERLVATVTLEGQQIDGNAQLLSTSRDNATFWAATKVRYAMSAEGVPEWNEVELHPVGKTMVVL